MGHITTDNIIGLILQREHQWDRVATYVETVLREKREAENDVAGAAGGLAEGSEQFVRPHGRGIKCTTLKCCEI